MNPATPVIITDSERKSLEEVKIAEHQEEYQTLPVVPIHQNNVMLSRWIISDEELEEIIRTRSIYVYQMNFNRPLQPILLSTNPNEVLMEEI